MPDKDRNDPVRSPPRTADEERARMDEAEISPEVSSGQEPRRQSPRPDPRTGEVPAGPGDAGLENRPELNTGSPGTRQMSNRRLATGLGIAALLGILVWIFAAVF